mmetsp:Transcript_14817/g.34463  ORF Transcript_14817/g.34463 Transcript_14817/m.34463 type:complete len:353 (-) Transcript_14817:386-1444(-)
MAGVASSSDVWRLAGAGPLALALCRGCSPQQGLQETAGARVGHRVLGQRRGRAGVRGNTPPPHLFDRRLGRTPCALGRHVVPHRRRRVLYDRPGWARWHHHAGWRSLAVRHNPAQYRPRAFRGQGRAAQGSGAAEARAVVGGVEQREGCRGLLCGGDCSVWAVGADGVPRAVRGRPGLRGAGGNAPRKLHRDRRPHAPYPHDGLCGHVRPEAGHLDPPLHLFAARDLCQVAEPVIPGAGGDGDCIWVACRQLHVPARAHDGRDRRTPPHGSLDDTGVHAAGHRLHVWPSHRGGDLRGGRGPGHCVPGGRPPSSRGRHHPHDEHLRAGHVPPPPAVHVWGHPAPPSRGQATRA